MGITKAKMIFQEFPKIARLKREIILTEKLDGTNAQVFIANKLDIAGHLSGEFAGYEEHKIAENETQVMFAGSRNRWINVGKEKDNAGFAAWVKENSEELFKLGEGHHYGEWYGRGIQRGYGLDHKRFALFNTSRWSVDPSLKPKCVELVPILYKGDFTIDAIDKALENLRNNGSVAVPGYMNPEGVVVFHVASRNLYKVTLEKDNQPKTQIL